MSRKYMVESKQMFHPHGEPVNVFDTCIRLRNEHFLFVQPLAESFINSGSSSCQNTDSVQNGLAETE